MPWATLHSLCLLRFLASCRRAKIAPRNSQSRLSSQSANDAECRWQWAKSSGITSFGQIIVHDVFVRLAPDCGLYLFSDNHFGSNANCWRIDNFTAFGCGGHGVFVNGMDGNAGPGTHILAGECTPCNFSDNFLKPPPHSSGPGTKVALSQLTDVFQRNTSSALPY